MIRRHQVVALAASAGGVKALGEVLAAVPADCPAAFLVVLHLDARHPSLLAAILDRRTALRTREAADGDRLEPGTVFVAPAGHHLLVNPDGSLSLSHAELVHFVRPSADLLFESVAASFRDGVVAVVLSGSGVDGAAGTMAVKKTGGTVLVQDEATSEFFGMPGAVIDAGAADRVLPLGEIGPAIVNLVTAVQV